jgi:hypothetical protein
MAGSYKDSNEISNAPKKENMAAEQLKRFHIPVLLQPKNFDCCRLERKDV